MRKVLILAEGQTEETFIRGILKPALAETGVYPIPTLIRTGSLSSGSTFKGGYVTYAKIKRQIKNLLADTSAAAVTTMLDLYKLPSDFPGRKTIPSGIPYTRVAYLEQAFGSDIDYRAFIPYIALYEFEALLFADPDKIAEAFPDNKNAGVELRSVRAQFNSPEEINDEVPPSKRIISIIGEYRKQFYGSLIARAIGLPRIRAECPHFSQWVERLENLVEVK